MLVQCRFKDCLGQDGGIVPRSCDGHPQVPLLSNGQRGHHLVVVRGSRSSAFKREELEPFVEHSRDLTERRAAHQYSISLRHASNFVLYIKTHVKIQGLVRDSKYSRSRRVAAERPSPFFRTILQRYWVQARLDLPSSSGRGEALKHRRMH